MGAKNFVTKNKKDNEKYKSDKINLTFLKNIVNDSFARFAKMNSFSIFNSINDILYLVYSTEKKSIVFYNMINNQKIAEIKTSHKFGITNFTYYLDNFNKRDLIISISGEDNNLKLWNVNNLDCLLNIENETNNLKLYSACLLNDNNQIYIVIGNLNNEPSEIFDLNGNIVKKINNFNDSVFFIDTYYDIMNSRIYILTCNTKFVKSYDYTNNKEYHIYNDLNKGYINSSFKEYSK